LVLFFRVGPAQSVRSRVVQRWLEAMALRSLLLLALAVPCHSLAAIPAPTLRSRTTTARAAAVPLMVGTRPALLTAALTANALAETLNGVFYISPLRNGVIKSLFGVAAQDVFSPISGAFMYLGGLHVHWPSSNSCSAILLLMLCC
jgi:hypothetical protein